MKAESGARGEDLARKVGRAIARERKIAGYTQARVGDALGLEKETISRIETGVIVPSIHRLAQFADLFRCPLSALFGEYRGGGAEDAGAIAQLVAGLPQDDRRAILRIISEVAAIARDREILRQRFEIAEQIPRRPDSPRPKI